MFILLLLKEKIQNFKKAIWLLCWKINDMKIQIEQNIPNNPSTLW